MKARIGLTVVVGLAACAAVVATVAVAGGGKQLREHLTGYEETPVALSTPGKGDFKARIDRRGSSIEYVLRYRDLVAPVTQAHIHFGAEGQTGGISVFLCSNLGNGPAGTQPCPAQPATITGTIVPKDVIGPTEQGIDPNEFGELLAAIRAEAAYVNVHSEKYPVGEIRAQLGNGDGGDHRGRGDRD